MIDAAAAGVVHIAVALISGGEAPAAIPILVPLLRLLPVAVAHPAAVHQDSVSGEAALGALPVIEVPELLLGDGLDGVDDPLILVLLVPALKLAEQFRIQVLHIWNLLLLTLSGAGCQARLAR